jgi:flagellar hook protein FlgE
LSQIQTAGMNTIAAMDQWMKTIASNVTGSTVTGFKGTNVQFGQVLEVMNRGASKPTEGYGSVNAISSPDSGTMVRSTETDFSQGTIVGTSNAGNMAISGDAFFVVSRVPVPRTMEDLQFTRNGDFHWDFLPGDIKDDQGNVVKGVGTFRLVNQDGLFVQGYSSPVIDGVRPFGHPPEESLGTDINDLSLKTIPDAPGQQPRVVGLQNIQLDLARNPDATNHIAFDAQGLVHVNGIEPRDLANNKSNMFVSLVKFANRDGLDRKGGGSYFNYDNVAGEMFAGVAGTGNVPPGNKVVGSTNVIVPQSTEAANTSINTTMPQITLAQKSFSAATKIISVGNSMIDDANQLIK